MTFCLTCFIVTRQSLSQVNRHSVFSSSLLESLETLTLIVQFIMESLYTISSFKFLYPNFCLFEKRKGVTSCVVT